MVALVGLPAEELIKRSPVNWVFWDEQASLSPLFPPIHLRNNFSKTGNSWSAI
ncbi:uncharacterized protein ACLA_013180 [Aspergillus clavatus NRRL 1]|uniref:Uncharacterized protein n=1 Tax=Aspergillus clavatus (strain ATCC 1007 / CBS 513.65 / DSM 816 / NCTC 3887 / NRRL 1 / QM 1276 / 107) TaxID=344612 RepID=A1CAW5_ASPCL|nr:uncharacterized protein ACLA_013180 [Aspergillus clavatus NRRL 1]EAW12883.1 hypothetical protein ACLA_013180 [Aspergillus clavatus NRRL 1]